MRPEVTKKIAARETANRIYDQVRDLLGYEDPDVMEKVDELVLAIYDVFDVLFVECSICDGDEISEIAHLDREGNWVCGECWDERLR